MRNKNKSSFLELILFNYDLEKKIERKDKRNNISKYVIKYATN